MFIPIGMDYTATLKGAVLKSVQCEHCSTEYVYQMERRGKGLGTSLLFVDNAGAQDRAETRAARSLQRKLETGCDVVPCPACGQVQQHMFNKARRAYARWMKVTGLLLLIPAFLFLSVGVGTAADGFSLVGITLWILIAGGVCLIASIGFLIAKLVCGRAHDPNSTDRETRIELGRSRALLKSEFEKLLREQGAEE